jgi:hypothetical protein
VQVGQYQSIGLLLEIEMTKKGLRFLCEEFVNSIKFLEGNYDRFIEEKLIEKKIEIDKIIYELEYSNNLRLYDPVVGGMLRGNISSRKNVREHWNDQNEFLELFCEEKNLNREVGFERALFNLGSIEYNKHKENISHHLNILSYESPLVRKKKGNLNVQIGNPFARCDLIGVTLNNLLALEIKTNPYNQNTNLPFALIESLFYGYILSYHANGKNRSEVLAEVNFCKSEYRKNSAEISKNFDVLYSIGAPKKYFESYKNNKNRKRNYFSRLWLSEARNIEVAIVKLKDHFPDFGGYFVFSQSEQNVTDSSNLSMPVPVFKDQKAPIWCYNSITDIIEDFQLA